MIAPALDLALDMRPDRRDAAGMSEDAPNVASPKATEPAPATEPHAGGTAGDLPSLVDSATIADLANPSSVKPEGGAALNGEPSPVNKLHEWGAAVAIMAFLTLILFGFLFFLRGLSL